jgi:antitoxin component YwqK of YwqJK toxin-antitoxin module
MKQTLLIITALMLVVGFSNADAQTYQYIEEFYDNGLPKVIKTFKESKGKLELVKEIKWHENGQKEEEGAYKDGEQDGKYTRWHENGQKKEEGAYKDGEQDGKYTRWHENGQKKEEGTYKGVDQWGRSQKDGKYTRWHENGQKEEEGYYRNGIKDAIRILWSKKGQMLNGEIYYYDEWRGYELEKLLAQTRILPKEDGEFIFYNNYYSSIDSRVKIVEGRIDGEFISWFSNGNEKMNGMIKNGSMVDEWVFYWPGEGQLLARGHYVNGDGGGIDEEYELNIPRNGREGVWEYYYQNGKKWCKKTFKNGEPKGEYIEWHENGQKKVEGVYEGSTEWGYDKEDGEWTSWYENGQKMQEGSFMDDELIESECWDEDGNECRCFYNFRYGCI